MLKALVDVHAEVNDPDSKKKKQQTAYIDQVIF